MLELIFSTSRAGAEAFAWREPFAVISITDPGSKPVSFEQSKPLARCDLQFWDVVDGVESDLFDAAMARRALEFVERECGEATLLVVHCEAGISRSTAMAESLGRIHNVAVRHHNALYVNPNPLVARLVAEQAREKIEGSKKRR
jgi:predicted protein tyrosine phosphatase